jgi:hypothetical protein
MNSLSLTAPMWLLLLPLVLLLPFVARVGWQGLARLRFRHAFVHRFLQGEGVVQSLKPSTTDWLVWLGGVLMVFALAQPIWHLSQGTEVAEQQQSDGVVVLEASVSMLLTEADGQSRLAQSQHWLTQLLAQRDANARTGLVVFGDDAYQVLSATTDASLLSTMIQRINPALAGRGDSALLEGLTLGLAELVNLQSSSGWVLLVHDGAQSTMRGEFHPLLDWAKQHGIHLAVLSIGGLQASNSDTAGLLYSPRSDDLMQQLAIMGAITASFDDVAALSALQAALLQAQKQTTTRFVAGQELDLMPYLLILTLLVWALPWAISGRSQ